MPPPPPTIPLEETGSRLTIDLGAIKANYRTLAVAARGAETAAVVKADAYGLSIAMVAPALWQAGARSFFVAHPAEARALRHALPAATIHVLNGLTGGGAPALAEIGARPILGSIAEIEEWASFCRGSGAALPAAIHVDTGINRLGLSHDEAAAIAGRGDLRNAFTVDLVMSHMACADTPGHALNGRQLERFRAARALFPGARASLANSAATLALKEAHFDLVRPGIALFGGRAVQGRAALACAARLEARIIQIRDAAPGEAVGYGATYTVKAPARLAILSIGYADGYPRNAGAPDGEARAHIFAAGHKVPVVGRVSMDLTAIDISALPQDALKRGDMVEVMGPNALLDDLADATRTIGYELLTRLGARVARVHTDSSLESA